MNWENPSILRDHPAVDPRISAVPLLDPASSECPNAQLPGVLEASARFSSLTLALQAARSQRLHMRLSARLSLLAAASVLATVPASARQAKPSASNASVDWPAYGNDAGGMKYSPLADVNRSNVAKLEVAFTWEAHEQPIPASEGQKAARPGQFEATPLAIHDTLFFPTPYNRVIALDATTRPRAVGVRSPSRGRSTASRATARDSCTAAWRRWTDGKSRRVFMNSRWRLIALDAATGKADRVLRHERRSGRHRRISLVPVRREHYTNTSPPVVWGNLVILGNGVGDRLVYHGDPPGDIQAFDVRTGKRVWRFKTVPEPASSATTPGRRLRGSTGSHERMGAVHRRLARVGFVYLPVGTPSDDWYGGERKGADLFGETILCLDARTGQARLAFPDRASWPVGLRSSRAAESRHRELTMGRGWTSSSRRRSRDSCSSSIA